MILTTCAACAAPLAHTAPRCVRCHSRYCNKTCQMDHWRRGHKQICKRIHRGGNAEQYYADKKYKEAVAVAVEACADDTKGQKCFICTQALHWKTKEGLVRGCACRGTAGFAHVSCLTEQAKILMDEAEENNLDDDRFMPRWERWHTCSLCEQEYHGVVACALGWACWKTYVGRPETDNIRISAMRVLGSGLCVAKHHAEALSVREAEFSTLRRLRAPADQLLSVQGNLASSYHTLGKSAQALKMDRDVYSGLVSLHGEEHKDTLSTAFNYANTLNAMKRFEEAKSLLCRSIPAARRALGESHEVTLRMRWNYAGALVMADNATLDDLHEAVATFEEIEGTARRVLGGAHPLTAGIEDALRKSRAALRARETPASSA